MVFFAVKIYFSVTQRKKSDKNHDVRVEVCGFFGNRSRLLSSQLGQLSSGFTMALYSGGSGLKKPLDLTRTHYTLKYFIKVEIHL